MLVVEGLTCRFGKKAAVDNASFSVAPGSFVGVIGRSGAGHMVMLEQPHRVAGLLNVFLTSMKSQLVRY
jgi:phosphonate transport system ATP-binding protein